MHLQDMRTMGVSLVKASARRTKRVNWFIDARRREDLFSVYACRSLVGPTRAIQVPTNNGRCYRSERRNRNENWRLCNTSNIQWDIPLVGCDSVWGVTDNLRLSCWWYLCLNWSVIWLPFPIIALNLHDDGWMARICTKRGSFYTLLDASRITQMIMYRVLLWAVCWFRSKRYSAFSLRISNTHTHMQWVSTVVRFYSYFTHNRLCPEVNSRAGAMPTIWFFVATKHLLWGSCSTWILANA